MRVVLTSIQNGQACLYPKDASPDDTESGESFKNVLLVEDINKFLNRNAFQRMVLLLDVETVV